jgi:outer membrane protein OmpA-like peptidoglycan-associated protein
MIQFQYKSAEITPESKKLLEGVADMFQKEMAGKKVVILGHTDNVGGSEYNLKLSEERAESAKEFLIQHGVESYRLQARGVGKDQPICDNDTEEGRTKNRRVEFEISGL